MTRISFLVLAAVALALTPAPGDPRAAASSQLFLEDGGPMIVAEREVCSLMDAGARDYYIAGQDGTGSVVVNGTSYWGFGDTSLTPGNPSGRALVPNNIAYSSDSDASNCVELTHKAVNGVAAPLIEPLPGEQTLWPGGFVPFSNTTVYFYVASVVPGPTPWYIRGIGLAKFDTRTLQSTRIHELMWDSSSGFGDSVMGVGWPVVQDGIAYLFLNTSQARMLLARVPVAGIETLSAYEYWDGAAWSGDPADAVALWTNSDVNGTYVRWSAPLGKWLAVYAGQTGTRVRVRTADMLTGPWSRDFEWFDCGAYVSPTLLPQCYTMAFHPQFDRDGGRKMYLTFATLWPYEVVLHEVRLGVPVRQWRAGADVRFAPQSPGAQFTSEGIAFYASDVSAPGFAAFHRFVRSDGDSLYRTYLPALGYTDAGIAFYAPIKDNAPDASLDFAPVYQWDKDGEHVLSPLPGWELQGYTRGTVQFYARCGDQDRDGLTDCAEIDVGTDPHDEDSDNDGWGDRPASMANPNSVRTMDNCPLTPNPSQTNGDGEPVVGSPGTDASNPSADAIGDECDDDLDNDGLSNAEEAAAGTGATSVDSDGDHWPDGAETLAGSDPLAASGMPAGTDSDGDTVPDALEEALSLDPSKRDTDGDGTIDLIELRWTSNAALRDTDGDACDDPHEIASVNGDRLVTAADLQMIAQRFGRTGVAAAPVDTNRDGSVGSVDLFLAAQAFGPC